jgi:hypothetical protein
MAEPVLNKTAEKEVGTGYFLLRVWGSTVIVRLDRMIQIEYPPSLKVPKDWGI